MTYRSEEGLPKPQDGIQVAMHELDRITEYVHRRKEIVVSLLKYYFLLQGALLAFFAHYFAYAERLSGANMQLSLDGYCVTGIVLVCIVYASGVFLLLEIGSSAKYNMIDQKHLIAQRAYVHALLGRQRGVSASDFSVHFTRIEDHQRTSRIRNLPYLFVAHGLLLPICMYYLARIKGAADNVAALVALICFFTHLWIYEAKVLPRYLRSMFEGIYVQSARDRNEVLKVHAYIRGRVAKSLELSGISKTMMYSSILLTSVLVDIAIFWPIWWILAIGCSVYAILRVSCHSAYRYRWHGELARNKDWKKRAICPEGRMAWHFDEKLYKMLRGIGVLFRTAKASQKPSDKDHG